MREICLAGLNTVCLLSGLFLRYSPIVSGISPKQKRNLWIGYGIAMAAHFLTMCMWFLSWGLSMAASKNIGVLFAIVTTLVNILVVRKRTREHLFVFGVVIVCNYLLLAIPSYCYTLLLRSGSEMNPFLMLVIYGGALVATFRPLRKMVSNTVEPFFAMECTGYWNAIWFIPVAMFGMLMAAFPDDRQVDSVNQLVGGVFCALIMIVMCREISKDHKRIWERELFARQMEEQKLYYAKLQAKVEEARKNSHDFKHVANVLNHHLVNCDLEGLRSCCQELVQQMNQTTDLYYHGSSVAGALVSRYVDLAKESQIQIKVQGKPDCPWVEDTDISVILGNLLDNAIEGCQTIPENRKVIVMFQNTDCELSILIQNTYNGVVNMENGEITSRKRSHMVGVGLQSVQELCEKYAGEMDVCPGEYLFSVSLLLRKQAQEET